MNAKKCKMMMNSPKMSLTETIKRYAVNTVGIYIMTFAIRLTVSSGLGTTPLSTLPNVFSLRFPQISFGMFTFIWNMVMLAAQIIVLRKNFKLIQLMQIPLTFVFSAFLDINERLLAWFKPDDLVSRLIAVAVGCVLMGVSVEMTVSADVVMNTGEAVVKAFCDTFGWNFGFAKIGFDVLYVVSGLVLSLIMFGCINGVGIGTVILAVATGLFVNLSDKLFSPIISKFYG